MRLVELHIFSIYYFPFSIFHFSCSLFFFLIWNLQNFIFAGRARMGINSKLRACKFPSTPFAYFVDDIIIAWFFFFDWLFLASLPRFSLLSHSIPWRKTYVHNPIEPSPICLVLNYLWYSFFFFFFSFFLIWLTPSTWRLSIDCLDPDFFGNSTIAVAKSSNLSTRPNTLLSTLVCAYQVPWPYASSKMY